MRIQTRKQVPAKLRRTPETQFRRWSSGSRKSIL